MDSLFFNLPVQLSPALETKQANARYHNSVQSLGLPGPKGLRPRYAPIPRPQAAVPVERVSILKRHKLEGPIYAKDFIGPLDLRRESVKRFDAGMAQDADYFKGKTARALKLGEVAREMAGTVDPVQIGTGKKQDRVVYRKMMEV